MPSVSLYSFDPSTFSTTTPGETPGLSASPSPGEYDHTLAVELNAHALSGTPEVQVGNDVAGGWDSFDSPHVVYIHKDMVLRVRAANTVNGQTFYSQDKTLVYRISQPALADSDRDGIPDAWEIKYGFDPLSSGETPMDTDSDGDGYSDFDEILRGSDPGDAAAMPLDSDHDGWSNKDEELRGTSPILGKSRPSATRLYEVESQLSGIFYDHEGVGLWAAYRVETVGGNQTYSSNSNEKSGEYGCRIPVGEESVIRGVSYENDAYIVKRYIASVPDLSPKQMLTDGISCTGEDCIDAWQEAWWTYLQDHLVQTDTRFDIRPFHMLPAVLMERQLEILAGAVPDDILAALPPKTPEEPWLAFATENHRPAPSLVAQLRAVIGETRELVWMTEGVQPQRTLNDLASDLARLAAQPCITLSSSVAALYADPSAVSVESRISRLLQGRDGTYLAGLALHYTLDAMLGFSVDVCETFDPDGDSDGDGLKNYEESPLTATPDGVADPFRIDLDQDGVVDGEDNCPQDVNPDQHDWDGDGLGDICDSDDDNDGLDDDVEAAFGSSPHNGDTDQDGISDVDEWQAATDPGVSVYVTGLKSPCNQTSQTIYGYREKGAVINLRIDNGAQVGAVVYPNDSAWFCTLSDMTLETDYSLQFRGTDGTDREGFGSETITIDLTAPQVEISSPGDGSVLDINSPVLVFKAGDGTVDVQLDGEPINTVSGDTLGPLDEGGHTLVVTATDAAGNSSSDRSDFTVDANQPPMADAGPDQRVLPGSGVKLSALNTIDKDSAISAWSWTQEKGTPVILTGSSTQEPYFEAPAIEGGLIFRLTVTDEFNESSQAICLVNVSDTNLPPSAHAGADILTTAQQNVQLDATASTDPEGGVMTYRWEQIEGPAVTLNDITLADPTFNIGSVGEDGVSFIFEVTVEDDGGLFTRDQVVVTAESANLAPVALAGDDRVADYSETVTLSGLMSYDSDGAGTISAYHWKQVFGTPVILSDPQSSQVSFTAPLPGVSPDAWLVFRLTVCDDEGLTDQEEVAISLVQMDQDSDSDIDGKDLAGFAAMPGLTTEALKAFASRFGK